MATPSHVGSINAALAGTSFGAGAQSSSVTVGDDESFVGSPKLALLCVVYAVRNAFGSAAPVVTGPSGWTFLDSEYLDEDWSGSSTDRARLYAGMWWAPTTALPVTVGLSWTNDLGASMRFRAVVEGYDDGRASGLGYSNQGQTNPSSSGGAIPAPSRESTIAQLVVCGTGGVVPNVITANGFTSRDTSATPQFRFLDRPNVSTSVSPAQIGYQGQDQYVQLAVALGPKGGGWVRGHAWA